MVEALSGSEYSDEEVDDSPKLDIIEPSATTAYYCQKDSKELYLYDYSLKKGRLVELKEENVFPSLFDSVQVGTRIFISGGFTKGKILKDTFEVNVKDETLVQLSYMLSNRRNHTLVPMELKDTFYALGGLDDEGFVKPCEKYNIPHDDWSLVPKLKQTGFGLMACSFNNQLLYTFGGYIGLDTYTDMIQKLDCDLHDHWVEIALHFNQGWSPRTDGACLQISPNSILLFGGQLPPNDTSSESYIFNIEHSSVSKTKNSLLKKECFFERKPIIYNAQELIIIGFVFKDIHMYSLKDQSWRMIEKKGQIIEKMEEKKQLLQQ